jgi:hypothetical protein
MSSTHVGRSSLGQTGRTVRLGTHAGARASAAAFDVDDLDRARASAATASASTTFARHPRLGTERGAALAVAPNIAGVGVFGRGCGGGGFGDGAITSEIQQSGGGVFGCAGVKTFPTISTGCARAPPAPPARLLRGSTPLAAFRGRAPRARVVVPSRLSVAHAAAIVGDAAGAISADGGAFGSTAATSVAGGAACEEALTELSDDHDAN